MEDTQTAVLPYSMALRMLKAGRRVARAGWNGKGMWLKMVGANNYAVAIGTIRLEAGSGYIEGQTDALELLPWIGMKTADNKFVPWLCSQTDMIAEDWVALEDD